MAIGADDLGRITQKTTVIASDGDRLGTIDQIYTSDTSGDPAWVTLKTGLFGTQESFVPLSDASFDGDDLRVGVTKDAVHGAPRVDAGGHLGVEQEDELYRHYGLRNPGRPETDVYRTAGDRDDDRDDDRGDDRGDGRDVATGDARGDHSLGAGAGAAAGAAAAAGADRDDELAQRDAEGRDEVADRPDAAGQRTPAGAAASGARDEQEAVRPGERTTRLRRYVVTERVVQSVEELPDDDQR